MDLWINLSNRSLRGRDLMLANLRMPIPLGRYVVRFNGVEVDQLQTPHAKGRQLNGNLPANGPDADHGSGGISETRRWNQPTLPFKAIRAS